jgi:hypothetical protein
MGLSLTEAQMKQVYGVEVEEKDAELVKKIADLLHGHSAYGWGKHDHDVHGYKKCAHVALKAVEEAKKL